MRFHDLVRRVSRVLDAIINGLAWIGAGAMVIMVLVVVSNVVGRYVFRRPVLGAVEMVGLLTVIVVFCVLAFTESEGAHIVVDIVLSRLRGRTKAIFTSVMCFLGAIFFIIMGWQGWDLMWSNLFPRIRTTGVLSLPFAPFMFIMAFGCVLFGLELLVHTFSILESEERERRGLDE
jgi:TRAP-type C4-dicarboxylate transport system permease small subunit